MILIAYLFLILRTAKDVVTQMSKRSCFRTPLLLLLLLLLLMNILTR